MYVKRKWKIPTLIIKKNIIFNDIGSHICLHNNAKTQYAKIYIQKNRTLTRTLICINWCLILNKNDEWQTIYGVLSYLIFIYGWWMLKWMKWLKCFTLERAIYLDCNIFFCYFRIHCWLFALQCEKFIELSEMCAVFDPKWPFILL